MCRPCTAIAAVALLTLAPAGLLGQARAGFLTAALEAGDVEPPRWPGLVREFLTAPDIVLEPPRRGPLSEGPAPPLPFAPPRGPRQQVGHADTGSPPPNPTAAAAPAAALPPRAAVPPPARGGRLAPAQSTSPPDPFASRLFRPPRPLHA